MKTADGVSSLRRAATARPHGPAPMMITSRISSSSGNSWDTDMLERRGRARVMVYEKNVVIIVVQQNSKFAGTYDHRRNTILYSLYSTGILYFYNVLVS